MYTVKSEKFEGPLDLLLKLIEGEKLDICQVSLSKITNTYLVEIEKMTISSEEMAEFVVIASQLLYLKSKELLPDLKNEETEHEIADLEAALVEYQKYKEAAKNLEGVLNRKRRSFSRLAMPAKTVVFTPPIDLSQQKLWQIFKEVLSRIDDNQPTEIIPPVKISIEDKKTAILMKIKDNRSSFKSLITRATSKMEIIVTFLAILELIKQKRVVVRQNNNFADFTLSRVK